jgi:hypothetical protein
VGWGMLKVAFNCTLKMVLTQRPVSVRLVEVQERGAELRGPWHRPSTWPFRRCRAPLRCEARLVEVAVNFRKRGRA